jgi:Mg2+/Co2+ transporter CorB
LGNLIVKSTTDVRTTSAFTALSMKTGGAQIVNGGVIEVAAAIPEPSSVMLLIAGLVAAGGLAYRRRDFVD